MQDGFLNRAWQFAHEALEPLNDVQEKRLIHSERETVEFAPAFSSGLWRMIACGHLTDRRWQDDEREDFSRKRLPHRGASWDATHSISTGF
jgi:hypothetical protein